MSKCDAPWCPGRDEPAHEIESGPEIHPSCADAPEGVSS